MSKAKTVEVWRLETEDGVGAYEAGVWPIAREDHPHPGPHSMEEKYTDLDKQLTSIFFFGFKDLDQLKAWFAPHDLDRAHLADVKARRFRVSTEHVLQGRYQIAFDRSKAELLETLRPTEV